MFKVKRQETITKNENNRRTEKSNLADKQK